MRSILLVISFAVFSFTGWAQTDLNTIYTYDFRQSTSDSIRAASFANWYKDVVRNPALGVAYCESFGITASELANAVSARSDDAESIAREFDFYNEQEPGFQNKLIKFLQAKRSVTENLFAEKTKSGTTYLVILAAERHDQFDLGLINTGAEKNRLKKIEFSGNNAEPVSGGVFMKNAKRTNRKNIGNTLLTQRFKRNNTGGVSIYIQTTHQKLTIELPQIAAARPYIRKFFPSTYEVLEGERIAITWEVLGAKNVFVNNEVGSKPNKWQIMFSPITDTEFTLVATNESGSEESTFLIHSIRSVLMNATITYFSAERADPKELNTKVRLELYDENMKVVANHTGLDDMKISAAIPYSGPFDLDISGTVYKRDLKKGRFVVTISGDKTDEWMFSPILILNFSDGTDKKLYGYGNKTISTKGENAVFEF